MSNLISHKKIVIRFHEFGDSTILETIYVGYSLIDAVNQLIERMHNLQTYYIIDEYYEET